MAPKKGEPAAAYAAPATASDSMAQVTDDVAAALSRVNENKRLLAEALAEVEAAQREKLKADETMADLNAEALLLDEGREARQVAKKNAQSKKRGAER